MGLVANFLQHRIRIIPIIYYSDLMAVENLYVKEDPAN